MGGVRRRRDRGGLGHRGTAFPEQLGGQLELARRALQRRALLFHRRQALLEAGLPLFELLGRGPRSRVGQLESHCVQLGVDRRDLVVQLLQSGLHDRGGLLVVRDRLLASLSEVHLGVGVRRLGGELRIATGRRDLDDVGVGAGADRDRRRLGELAPDR